MQTAVHESERRLLRRPDVSRATGLGRSTIYRLVRLGRFPSPLKISDRASAWVESDVQAWIHERIAAAQGDAERALP